jgi:beta-D-xylosidase 4
MRTIASVAAIAVLASLVWALQFPDCVNGPKLLTTNLVCNTSAAPADRAKAIVAAMNITEKIANMIEYLSLLHSVS